MGKVRFCLGPATRFALAAALLVGAALSPWRPARIAAQSAPPAGNACAGAQPVTSPMQGHYTGPWQSSGDYHFAVHFPAFNGYPASDVDLEMKIIVDGSLDVTVDSNGQVSGTATGNVNAPIYHDGQQDISSGIGTISGPITGVFSTSGSLLVLSHPTIDMHWGTFGGGHAVETFPVMPDYQLAVGPFDCVSAQGTSTEQGFPDMNITNDSTGQLTHAPGVGTASGTWHLTSDQSSEFSRLSQQVDSFINQANSLLGDASAALTPALAEQKIAQPLKSLEQTIQQNPDVARCLLDRLHAWEASTASSLLQRTQSLAGTADLVTLRRASDLLRSARLLSVDCSISDGGAAQAVEGAERSRLDRAVAGRDWAAVALLAREAVLLQGETGRGAIQQEMDSDLHALLQSTSDGSSRLDAGRIAYALGDGGDAAAAKPGAHALRPLATALPWHPVKGHKKQTKSKSKKKRKPATKRAPKPKPTVRPTATPVPQSLSQILSAGVAQIAAQSSGGAQPVFSWTPVGGASEYVVAVTARQVPAILWTWSGSATSVTYGDTAIEGTPGTQADGWPVALPADYRWSVLALDGSGRIVGVRLG